MWDVWHRAHSTRPTAAKGELKTVMGKRTPGGGDEPLHPPPSSRTLPPDAVPQLSGAHVLSPGGLKNSLRPVPPQSREPRNPAAATPVCAAPAGMLASGTQLPGPRTKAGRSDGPSRSLGPRGPGIQSGGLRTSLAQCWRPAQAAVLTPARATGHVTSGKPRPFLAYAS